MFELPEGNSKEKVYAMCVFMSSKGLVFRHLGLDNSPPYAILMGGTSVGYRTRSKQGEKGIVFYCTNVDASRLSILGLNQYENNDEVRPVAVFVPNNMFEDAIEILKKNGKNTTRVEFNFHFNTGTHSQKKSKPSGSGLLGTTASLVSDLGNYVSGFEYRRKPKVGTTKSNRRRRYK